MEYCSACNRKIGLQGWHNHLKSFRHIWNLMPKQHPEHLGWTNRVFAETAQRTTKGGVLIALLENDIEGDWVTAEEADEMGAKVLVWGVSHRTGEKMLDEDGSWVVVA